MNHPTYKPESYNSVSPYLVVTDAAATIRFLESVFGATEIRRFPAADGNGIMHAEVRLDDTVIMLGDCAEGWPATPSHVHVYVPDVDATFRKALEHGATPLQEPVRKDDDDKRGGFKDASGTSWWIGTKEI
ncbi:MAG: VOC family protein [Opitutales bacterium]|nr:VOC family protein [Opitutales bacterium]